MIRKMNAWIWTIIIVPLIISILLPLFGFLIKILIDKYKNKRKIIWQFNQKLEATFLFQNFTNEEILEEQINGNWINLICSFSKHFQHFQNYILEEGFRNQKIALEWADYLNKQMRPFLVKWESFSLENKLKKEQPKEFFKDLKNIKENTKVFYYNFNWKYNKRFLFFKNKKYSNK